MKTRSKAGANTNVQSFTSPEHFINELSSLSLDKKNAIHQLELSYWETVEIAAIAFATVCIVMTIVFTLLLTFG